MPSISKGIGCDRHSSRSSSIHDAAICCEAMSIGSTSYDCLNLTKPAGIIENGGNTYIWPVQNMKWIWPCVPGMVIWYVRESCEEVDSQSFPGGEHWVLELTVNLSICRQWLTHMWQSVCLNIAGSWEMNWNQVDALLVANTCVLSSRMVRQVSLNDLVLSLPPAFGHAGHV